jgi:uncharacterized protein YeaO (DUF488 family)
LFTGGGSIYGGGCDIKLDDAMKLQIKRAYEAPEKSDGTRILVDRLWPRGLSRDKAAVDLWLKEAAPSAELRQWYAHQPELWPEFRRRYFAELDQQPEVVAELRSLVGRGNATLLYAAKDTGHNNAKALLEYLQS